MITHIILYIDPIITCFIIYLMIEENNKIYFKFIKILYKLKICCCLNHLMINTMQFMPSIHSNSIQQNNQNNKEIDNVLNSEITKDNSLKIEHSEYIDKSQISQETVNIQTVSDI